MFTDPLYIALILVGLPLIYLPQWWVKSTYEKYTQVPASHGQTGAEVAEAILKSQGIFNVTVQMAEGFLSDHYDPMHRTVNLSEPIFRGTSISSYAIAAHEVGHAIQHAQGFFPVVVRSAMVPAVNLGSQLGPILIFASILLMSFQILAPGMALGIAWFGVFLFGLAVLFHIVTLPVEINASMRAVTILADSRYLDAQEVPMAKHVLTAAAFTYVATALYSMIQLLYWVLTILRMSRSRD